jgi:hypothetical protein
MTRRQVHNSSTIKAPKIIQIALSVYATASFPRFLGEFPLFEKHVEKGSIKQLQLLAYFPLFSF